MGTLYDAAIAALEEQIAELQMALAVLKKQAGQSPIEIDDLCFARPLTHNCDDRKSARRARVLTISN